MDISCQWLVCLSSSQIAFMLPLFFFFFFFHELNFIEYDYRFYQLWAQRNLFSWSPMWKDPSIHVSIKHGHSSLPYANVSMNLLVRLCICLRSKNHVLHFFGYGLKSS